ncbi:MAG: DUF802 domain-containing protein, partial [Hydrogenophaga sp.]|nr:DUF802 domain-containing protein [Hydrogenophaga sp.]
MTDTVSPAPASSATPGVPAPHTASRVVWWLSLALGLLAVVWVATGFVGNNPLALGMTLAIGAVFGAGALEVHRFRLATAGLSDALVRLPQPLAVLDDWLPQVPAALRPAVRARIESERHALPGLALAPYLIGLLVMLGMLGTFLGMVVTFKGAVFALEGSTDLQAIRSALAAPIRGLGLSFGTSVAGVATSAMLGLMAALARRERVVVVRLLDALIAGELRVFSPARQRQQAFEALQQQAQALPLVAQGLQTLMDRLDERHQRLDEALLERQARFHHEAATAYTGLARSVEQSLKDSLAASAQAASASLQPIVSSAMAGVAAESSRLHERVGAAVQTQLDGLSTRFAASADAVAKHWQGALQQQAGTSERLVAALEHTLNGFSTRFDARATALLAGVQEHSAQTRAAQEQAAGEQLAAWTAALQALAADLNSQWQRAGEQALGQQQAVCSLLERTALAITEHTSAQASRSLEGVHRLLAQSEALVQARTASEAQWAEQNGQRMEEIVSLWRNELAALRDAEAARVQALADRLGRLQADTAGHLQALRADEDQRGQAALARLGELQTAVSGQVGTHLAALGT